MFCSQCSNELPGDSQIGANVLCRIQDGGCGGLVIPVEYVEEEYEEIEVPDCYRFFDVRDKICTGCPVMEICKEAFLARRQLCHGRYDENVIECMYCMMSSHCADDTQKETSSMPKIKVRKPPVKRKPQRPPRKPARKPAPVVEEPELEIEEELEEDEEPVDYGKMPLRALRKLCADMDLDPGGRKKSDYVKALLAYDAGDEEEFEEDDFDEPDPPVASKPARRPARGKKTRPTRKPARKPAPVAEVEEPELVEELAVADVEESPFGELIQILNAGDSLTFTKVGDSWSVCKGVPIPASVGTTGRSKAALKGSEFEEEAWSPEFYEYVYEDAAGTGKGWTKLTHDERVAVAEELEVEWTRYEDPKADAMYMGKAVREHLGIVKWKPEYKSTAARKALKQDGVYLT